MAKQTKSNKGWILGSALGAVAGAAYALWKTPASGQQIRSKFAPGSHASNGTTTTSTGGGVTDKIMGAVEHTLAPIVGVKLGKTANTKTGDAETVAVSSTVYTAGTTSTANGTDAEQTTIATQPDSIRAKRWEWGSPAPEPNTVDDPKFQAAETAQVESNLPEAAPDQDNGSDVTPTTNASPSFNSEPIRSRRFAWGDPAPETTTAPAATEFNAVPSSAAVMPEQTPAGSSLTSPGGTGDPGTRTGTPDINPERTESGSSLTSPSPQQRVVPTSARDAVGSVDGGDSDNVDDAIMVSAAGQSTGKMNAFPNLGGLEDNN